jgi:anion-transporting  ArsA/GET3 family ATPase
LSPKAGSVSNAPEKRSEFMTEEVYLGEEVKALKENLLAQVDALIVRQNQVEPVVKIESFEVETASRRVLKELVETYV